MFTKFGRLMRCKTADPGTVVGAGGGKSVVTTPSSEVTTAEEAMQKLHDLTEAVQNDTIEKEKFIEVTTELLGEIKELRLRASSKMRFSADATRHILRGGMKAAMLAPTKDENLKVLQELSDDIHIVDGILGYGRKAVKEYGGYKSLRLTAGFDRLYDDFSKTMDTAEAGAGAEWVPSATLSAEMQYAIELEARVAPLFPSFQMPQDTFNYPIRTSVGEAYRATEQTDITSLTKAKRTKLGTQKTLFDAEKLMGRIGYTGELNEDAIVAMMPEIKKALIIAHANAKDEGVIDGQPGGTIDTGDDPSGDANDVRMLFDGIRKYCQTNSAVKVDLGAAWNVEGLNSVRKKLGKAGMRPGELAWIPGVSLFYNLLTIKDDQNNNVVLTLEHYGGAATILTGELGKMFGIPVVPSDYIREDLNATGIYDGVTETKTILPIVHRQSWKWGNYKEIVVRSSDELYMESDVLVVVTRERLDFQDMFAFATQVAAALGYNLTP